MTGGDFNELDALVKPKEDETNYETGRRFVDRQVQNRRSKLAADHRRRRRSVEKATKKSQRRHR